MNCNNKCKNFEPKEKKDKNVFENDDYRIDVEKEGLFVDITFKRTKQEFCFVGAFSLPLLEKAIERARELRGLIGEEESIPICPKCNLPTKALVDVCCNCNFPKGDMR